MTTTRNKYQAGRLVRTCYACACVAVLSAGCTLDTDPAAPVQADMQPRATEWTGALAAAGAPAEPPAAAVVAAAEVEAQPSEPEPEPDKKEPAAASSEPKQEAPKEQPAAPSSNTAPAKEEKSSGCRPGKYTGVLNGTVNLTGLLDVGTMAGTIDLDLVADKENTGVLVVQNGRVVGIDDKHSTFAADLTGRVNCASGQVTETAVERGLFVDSTLESNLNFAGAARGQYTMDPPALVGTWEITDDTALLAGDGTWSVTLSESL